MAGDRLFKEYIESHFMDKLLEALSVYISETDPSKLDLRESSITDVEEIELTSIEIRWIAVSDMPGTRIGFDVIVDAELQVSGYTRENRYKTTEEKQWFRYRCEGCFKCNFEDSCTYDSFDIKVKDIGVYYREDGSEQPLSGALIPYIKSEQLEDKATEFLAQFYPEALEKPMPLDLTKLAYDMGLMVISNYWITKDRTIFGQIFFQNATATVYNRETLEEETIGVPSGTILVDPDIFDQWNFGTCNNTIVHECVHWWLHWKAVTLQALLNKDVAQIRCRVSSKNLSDDSLKWMERQAGALAPKILIPFHTGMIKFREILDHLHKTTVGYSKAEIMEMAVSQFADFFCVSIAAARIRAMELGFKQAVGVYNFVNGKYCHPYWFEQGRLGKKQTFTVGFYDAILESLLNKEFEKELFIYVDGLFVINDPKYVNIKEGRETFLTKYARDHVDECCLIFTEIVRENNKCRNCFGTGGFLLRDVDSRSFIEAVYNLKEGKNEDVIRRAKEMRAINSESKRLETIAAKLPSTFAGTLDYHIKRRGYTNEKMEELSLITSRTIQDYRKNASAKPALTSVLALGIALNLQPAFFYDLIAKAGYNIMTITEENLMYQFLINNHHMENIYMWNDKLKDTGLKQQLPKNGNKLIN